MHCIPYQDLWTDFKLGFMHWFCIAFYIRIYAQIYLIRSLIQCLSVFNGAEGKFKVVLPGFLWRTPQSPWQPGRKVRAHRRTGTERQVNKFFFAVCVLFVKQKWRILVFLWDHWYPTWICSEVCLGCHYLYTIVSQSPLPIYFFKYSSWELTRMVVSCILTQTASGMHRTNK